MTNQRDDYDNPWKESLSLYFQAFMAFFFPQIDVNIDWSRGYEFLDKEFQQVVRDAEIGSREADKLVKVWLPDGEETWILIHIEVQSQVQSIFAERMYVYNNRIFDKYRRQVVSLAVLADDQSSWRPTQYSYEMWGCRVLLQFPVVKLLDYQVQSDILWRSNNPFAVIVAAHLKTQQTRKNPLQRYQGKLRIAKSLYQRGYSRQDILELFRLIDWMMTLPDSFQSGFRQEIRRFEEENKMPYVTSIERLAHQEGFEEGQASIMMLMIKRKFGELDREVKAQIQKLGSTQLESLSEALLDFSSVEDLTAWLRNLNL
ncbi:MAG: DUF4351 domain-containing protein [Xenococcaceae cyanobacterium]